MILNRKRSIGVLVFIFIGLLLISNRCLGTIQAVSRAQKSTSENAFVPTGNLLAPGSEPAVQGNALLHFDPSPGQVTVGGVAAVQLRLENVANLYGIEVHLTFDARMVQVEDDDAGREGVQVAVGEIPHPEFLVQNIVDNTGGRLDYAVVQLAPRLPASGSGVVATIHFRGVSEGVSPIRFVGAKLASPDGVEIPVVLQDGTIAVGTSAPTDTPTPTYTPGGPTLTPTHTPVVPTHTPLPTVPSSPPTAAPTLPTDHTSTPVPPSAPSTTSQCPTVYVVRSGDTAFSIARRFGVSLNALATANGLPSSYYVQIGQLLTIPGVPGPTASTHVVRAGETLYSIARRYGTTVETLAALNRLPHPWHAPLGQTLLLCPP
jgi:LysM repeat protein